MSVYSLERWHDVEPAPRETCRAARNAQSHTQLTEQFLESCNDRCLMIRQQNCSMIKPHDVTLSRRTLGSLHLLQRLFLPPSSAPQPLLLPDFSDVVVQPAYFFEKDLLAPPLNHYVSGSRYRKAWWHSVYARQLATWLGKTPQACGTKALRENTAPLPLAWRLSQGWRPTTISE
jgi:hypothetical protein